MEDCDMLKRQKCEQTATYIRFEIDPNGGMRSDVESAEYAKLSEQFPFSTRHEISSLSQYPVCKRRFEYAERMERFADYAHRVCTRR